MPPFGLTISIKMTDDEIPFSPESASTDKLAVEVAPMECDALRVKPWRTIVFFLLCNPLQEKRNSSVRVATAVSAPVVIAFFLN